MTQKQRIQRLEEQVAELQKQLAEYGVVALELKNNIQRWYSSGVNRADLARVTDLLQKAGLQ